jgi:hypothetical protein
MFSPVRRLQHPNLPHQLVNRSPFLRTSGTICAYLLLLISDDGVSAQVSHTHILTPSPHWQPPPPTGQQVPISSATCNFADLLLPQLRILYAQIMHALMNGEKNLQADESVG